MDKESVTNLSLAGRDDAFHEVPGLGDGSSSNAHALVAQEEDLSTAQVGANGLGLSLIGDDARVAVVSHTRQQFRGLRAHWQQARLDAGDLREQKSIRG